MKSILLILAATCSSTIMIAQSTPTVTKISLGENKSGSVKGKLEDGAVMTDLSWAWNSSNACFPATQQKKFTGNHVLYQIDVPEKTEYIISVIPDDKNADFSLYAYMTGIGKEAVVPNLSSCIRCEADFKWDYKKKGQTQDHTRTVKDILAISSPYTAYIGVVGSNGLAKGGFTLVITKK